MTLGELRAEIDQVDRELVQLLNRRAKISQRVGEIKRAQAGDGHQPSVYQPDREAQVLRHVDDLNGGPLSDAALHAVYREILSSSRSLQRPLRIGYLGPIATFAYQAAKRHFGSSAIFVPCRTIPDVFTETEKRVVDYGVVPIENSTGGIVPNTLDRFLDTDLQICAEVALPVSHNLLSRGALEQITRVYSHPQALAQCRRWLAERLPHATQIETASTALAATMIDDPETAAISTEAASEVYEIPIVARSIEDEATNVTRFLVIGRQRSAPTGHDRTAIVFSIQDRAGALQEALREFAEHDINLTRIESRPSRRKLWEYVFFVDLEGHVTEEHIARALDRLTRSCSFVRVLGTWPVAHMVRRHDLPN